MYYIFSQVLVLENRYQCSRVNRLGQGHARYNSCSEREPIKSSLNAVVVRVISSIDDKESFDLRLGVLEFAKLSWKDFLEENRSQECFEGIRLGSIFVFGDSSCQAVASPLLHGDVYSSEAPYLSS